MAYQQIVIRAINQLCADDFWYVWETLAVKYPVNIFPAFFQPFYPHFLSPRIFAL